MVTYSRSGATETSVVDHQATEALAAAYDIRDERAVFAYLDEHPDLLEILAGLPGRVVPFVPIVARPALEIMRDPERDGPDGPLFALFPAQLPPPDALAQLARMRDEWWLDLYRQVGGRLNLDVEFR